MPTFRHALHAAAAALALALLAGASAFAAKPAVFATGEGAIRGYDPVAYFTAGEPVRGSAAHEYQWKGVAWRFSSVENLEKFRTDPGRYAPQYGGYCAWAVANGNTASTVPEAWTIVDGKLYLNYSTGVQARWSRDIPGNIDKADRNWPGVLE